MGVVDRKKRDKDNGGERNGAVNDGRWKREG